MESAGIVLKKQWFLTSRPGKIENHYNFDVKKVRNTCSKYAKNTVEIFWPPLQRLSKNEKYHNQLIWRVEEDFTWGNK